MNIVVVQRIFKIILPFGLLVALLAVALFGSYCLSFSSPEWLQFFAREIQAACRDAGTQWMVAGCLLSYFIIFVVLEAKSHARSLKSKVADQETERPTSNAQHPKARYRHPPSSLRQHTISSPTFLLCAFIVLVLLRYALDYASAARSLQVVVLLTGIVIGKGIALWAEWKPAPSQKSEVSSPKSGGVEEHPTFNFQLSTLDRARAILSILVFLLAVASLWHPERGIEFFYRGQQRWTGPWDNPNLFGVLMGVGTILAVGLLVSRLASKGQIQGASVEGRETKRPRFNSQRSTRNFLSRFASLVTRCTPLLLLAIAAAVCTYALLKSYSRGAWLGTVLALVFLLFQGSTGIANRAVVSFRRNWFPSSILVVSLFVICFWQFRHTEASLARRLFSVGNPNDFSWRNRAAAWEGAGRMMLDKPWSGFGWSKAEEIYSKEYRAARLEESAAIQMNDYLMLGMSAGVPALAFLVLYLFLTFARRKRDARNLTQAVTPIEAERSAELSTIAISGALVLLIGFWFDGGLFKLPTAMVFWVLIELVEFSPHPSLSPSGGERVVVRPPGMGVDSTVRWERALRWSTGVVATVALSLTGLHLTMPQLPVSERTLAVARWFLVPVRARIDFEFLAAKPIWDGQPLKVLLQHAHLANYNRTLVNWKLDDELYREFVLSPEIGDSLLDAQRWRRPLWEYFYPRIRKESSLDAAAEIVIRQLRELVKLTSAANPPTTILQYWQRGSASESQFHFLCVAALRSAGIPARLTSARRVEFWNGTDWRIGM